MELLTGKADIWTQAVQLRIVFTPYSKPRKVPKVTQPLHWGAWISIFPSPKYLPICITECLHAYIHVAGLQRHYAFVLLCHQMA